MNLSNNIPQIDNIVKFYDTDKANKDRNYSGEEKYWSTGKVINRRITDKIYLPLADIWLGGDDVVDIELPDGRISKGHFSKGVTVLNQ